MPGRALPLALAEEEGRGPPNVRRGRGRSEGGEGGAGEAFILC